MTTGRLLLEHVFQAGYPFDQASVIDLFIGGSQLHGAKVHGYDDLDIYGCYIEPPRNILGVEDREHFVWTSGAQGQKNTANDVDVTLYSLHRWAELLLKGNPAITHYLFAENQVEKAEASVWVDVLARRAEFICQKSARQYLGFAEAQRMRLTGERGMGRHGQRLDLVEAYGFDTKFAMHYVRLLLECRELLRDKQLTFPRPEKEFLIEIRTGKYSQEEVLRFGAELNAECNVLLAATDLPEVVDKRVLSDLVAATYLKHWRKCGW